MGVGTKKRPAPTQPKARKPGVQTGDLGGVAPPGCPDTVVVEGASESVSVGQHVSLTLTGGRVQLVVGNRVTGFSTIRPSRSRVVKCLEEGESYTGTVTRATGGRFEATLERVGG